MSEFIRPLHNQQEVNQQYNHPLSRRHHYNTLGQLTRIDLPLGQLHHYQYDNVGRLIAAQTPDFAQLYDFDPAGNRLLPLAEQQATAPQLDNRLYEDSQYRYQYDPYGNLIVKQHRRAEEYHHYYYDAQHRLIHYSKQQGSNHITHTRYLYDPLGRRLHKQTSYHDRQGRELRRTAHTWYGWDGDRLVMTERDNRQCYTIYSPDSFVPLLRLEGDIPPPVVSLAEKMSQQAEMIFPDIVVQRMHQLERELRQQQLSEESLSWLAMANLTPERLATQLDPLPSLPEKVHIYHCDHLGTPLALLDRRGKIGWQATRDPWGNIVRENNLEHLEQPIGMQGQHYDTESGLYYNRHRYYDPWQGKYITQDPIGLNGGINFYSYPGNPVQNIDALGLNTIAAGAAVGAAGGPIGAAVGAGIGAAIGIGAYLYATSDSDDESKSQSLACKAQEGCPPCQLVDGTVIPIGTIGYRLDLVPPSPAHYPLSGDHVHLYRANQAPLTSPKPCKCFWKEFDVTNPPSPKGAIPMQHFR